MMKYQNILTNKNKSNFIHELKIVIEGYFGANNIGDDAILETMLDSIRLEFLHPEIVVLASNPELIVDRYKVKAVSSNLKRSFLLIFKELLKADVFVLGGGGLFPNDSPRKIFGSLLILCIAKFLGVKKIVLCSIGVDPIRYKFSKILLKYSLNFAASVISVRDEESAFVLKNAGVNKRIYIYPDPAFLLSKDEVSAAHILSSVGINFDTSYMAVAIAKPWDLKKEPNCEDRYTRFLQGCSKCINDFMEKHPDLHVVLIPFSYPSDLEIAQEILKNLNNKNYAHILNLENKPKVVKSIISHSLIVLGMRYHSVIFSLSTFTPIATISYGPKTDSLLKRCNIFLFSERLGIRKTEFFKEEKDLDFESLCNKLEEVYKKRKFIKSQLEKCFYSIRNEVKPIGKLLKEI